MNEVKTFAKAGETAGAAVGTGVVAARKGAVKIGKQLGEHAADLGTKPTVAAMSKKAQKKATAAQDELAQRWGDKQGALSDYLSTASDVLGDKVLEARKELAQRIEPPKPRRWPLILLALAGIGVVAAAAAASRKPKPVDSDPLGDYPEAGTGAAGNGAVTRSSVPQR